MCVIIGNWNIIPIKKERLNKLLFLQVYSPINTKLSFLLKCAAFIIYL